jgi:hypothetical protein
LRRAVQLIQVETLLIGCRRRRQEGNMMNYGSRGHHATILPQPHTRLRSPFGLVERWIQAATGNEGFFEAESAYANHSEAMLTVIVSAALIQTAGLIVMLVGFAQAGPRTPALDRAVSAATRRPGAAQVPWLLELPTAALVTLILPPAGATPKAPGCGCSRSCGAAAVRSKPRCISAR